MIGFLQSVLRFYYGKYECNHRALESKNKMFQWPHVQSSLVFSWVCVNLNWGWRHLFVQQVLCEGLKFSLFLKMDVVYWDANVMKSRQNCSHLCIAFTVFKMHVKGNSCQKSNNPGVIWVLFAETRNAQWICISNQNVDFNLAPCHQLTVLIANL